MTILSPHSDRDTVARKAARHLGLTLSPGPHAANLYHTEPVCTVDVTQSIMRVLAADFEYRWFEDSPYANTEIGYSAFMDLCEERKLDPKDARVTPDTFWNTRGRTFGFSPSIRIEEFEVRLLPRFSCGDGTAKLLRCHERLYDILVDIAPRTVSARIRKVLKPGQASVSFGAIGLNGARSFPGINTTIAANL